MNWLKKLALGLKVALDIAIDAQDHGLIKVKELEKAKQAREILQKRVVKYGKFTRVE